MHRPKPPLPKGGGLAKPNRGDSAGKACGTSYLFPLHYSLKTFPFPHGFVLWWSANCESLSQKSKIFASSHRPGACGVPPLSMPTAAFCYSLLPCPGGVPPLSISHDSFLRIVTSLTRPVSFHCAIPGFFLLSIDSVGKKRPKNHNPKRGQ